MSILLAALYLASPLGDSPCLVICDTGENSKRWKDYQTSVFREYGLEDRLSARQRAYYARPSFYHFEDPDEYEATFGLAYFANGRSGIHRFRFRSVSNERTFERFVNAQVKRRENEGGDVTVDGNKHARVIRASPYKQKMKMPDGRSQMVPVTRSDFHIAYNEGVVGLGSESSKGQLSQLAPIARRARGKHWYLQYRPNAVPKTLRSHFLQEVEKASGVKLQRFDTESAAAYAVRKGLGDKYVQLLRSLVFDVEEVTSWTSVPSKNKPFKARLQIKAVPKSKLSRLLAELRGNRTITVDHDREAVGTINVNREDSGDTPCRVPVLFSASLCPFSAID